MSSILSKSRSIKVLPSFFAVFACLFILILPAQARAISAAEEKRCQDFRNAFQINPDNPDLVASGSLVTDLPDFCTAQNLVLKAINIGLMFSGSLAIVFIMLGGYFYLTSAGSEERSEKGKKILVNAIIGLVVIMMSIVIVRIVAKTIQSDTTNSNGAGPSSNSTSNSPNTSNAPNTSGSGNNLLPSSPGAPFTNEPPKMEDVIARLKAGITVPDSVPRDGTLKILAVYQKSQESDIKFACSVESAAAASLVVSYKNSQNAADEQAEGFKSGPRNFTAEVGIPASQLAAGSSVSVLVRLCGAILVPDKRVVFTGSNVSPRGEELSQATKEAASRVTFSASFVEDGKNLNLDIKPASPTDVFAVCKHSLKPDDIEVFIDGKSYGKGGDYKMQLGPFGQSEVEKFQFNGAEVEVKMCGISIGGGPDRVYID